MSGKRGVTLRAQWLGKHLRELRERAGLTLKEAGEYLQRDGSTVSRFEAGLYPARTPDVLALLDLYGVTTPQERDGLVRLSRDVWQNGWWDDYSGDVTHGIVDYAWVEARAESISSFDALVIPGLLQTRDYMEAVIRADSSDATDEQVDRWVDFRLTRQEIFSDESPRLSMVLDEYVLRRPVGGPEIMRAQLIHLAKHASAPNIEIRVLPLSAGAHASPDGAFRIFQLPQPFPAIAYVPTPAGAIYVEGEGTDMLKLKYDRIRRKALSAEESLRLISAVAKSLADV
ncbi:Helix-turn-helix domain protein [Nonomuraea coxensis DSM 45129]|uniref:Helix-turn-helix domain protein n=1 Tax=Nonomuraea coxensis DSM 45129 TaxID=1122611 RepID=A0ABX8UCF5_9ACTN|nr:helix-turn-helix transcriptional regulator [Nonomuraea coxensis]QYC45255.1 Helix-turn-helix domain protein [Nonomuraea coxensis DSM 45129]